MQRDQLFHAVYEALSPGHCAVCQVSLEGVQRFLDGFMYERVNDPWSRERLAAGVRGLVARGMKPSTRTPCARWTTRTWTSSVRSPSRGR